MFDADTVATIVVLLLQTSAGFFWGGQIHRSVRDHDRRINGLEKRELRRYSREQRRG